MEAVTCRLGNFTQGLSTLAIKLYFLASLQSKITFHNVEGLAGLDNFWLG